MKSFLFLCVAALLVPATLSAQVIVNDSWADGGRNNGADSLDTDWWYSTSSTAIEVSVGSLGLVSGASAGRGIHGTFPVQTLNVGDTLKATYSFSTPVTMGAGVFQAAIRVGLFDTTGKPGLAADIAASSGSPNAVYNNLFGYMVDYDVNNGTANNIQFRERTNATSGQLMASTTDYSALSSGGVNYTIVANTAYIGTLSITRTSATSLDLTSALFQGVTQLSTYTATDTSASTTAFGMLAFHVNSGVAGSSGTPNTADNGIDFSNVTIEYIAQVPEPSSMALLVLGAAGLLFRRRFLV